MFFVCLDHIFAPSTSQIPFSHTLLLLEVGDLVALLVAIGRAGVDLATGADGGGEVLEHGNGGVPVDAGVGDGDALLERGGALGGDLLVALVDVGLDHDADDGLFAFPELLADDGGDLGLVAVVLVGVACRSQYPSL